MIYSLYLDRSHKVITGFENGSALIGTTEIEEPEDVAFLIEFMQFAVDLSLEMSGVLLLEVKNLDKSELN